MAGATALQAVAKFESWNVTSDCQQALLESCQMAVMSSFPRFCILCSCSTVASFAGAPDITAGAYQLQHTLTLIRWCSCQPSVVTLLFLLLES